MPSGAFPTRLKPYHVCWKDFLSSRLASEISKDPRPERHGHIERSNSTLGNKSSLARGEQRPVVHRQTDLFAGSPRVLFGNTVKGPLFPSTNQNYYRTCFPNLKGAIYST